MVVAVAWKKVGFLSFIGSLIHASVVRLSFQISS